MGSTVFDRVKSSLVAYKYPGQHHYGGLKDIVVLIYYDNGHQTILCSPTARTSLNTCQQVANFFSKKQYHYECMKLSIT
jgi:hypothetical protein